MERNKIIDKILKCFRLAESSNPNEAAAAMVKAHKLMDIYQISDQDIDFAQVKEAQAKTGRKSRPPTWLIVLINVVAGSFGVKPILRLHEVSFIGIGVSSEVASYAFTVLRRKCENARKEFYDKSRAKRANRIRRADHYAYGWVLAVSAKVEDFARKVPVVVEAYLVENHSKLDIYKHNVKDRCSQAATKGFVDGQDVNLFQGVAFKQPELIT